MEQTLYAAWKYDQYPYFLMGEVVERLPDGRFKIKGYDGYFSNAILFLPKEVGEKKWKELEKLMRDYQKAQEDLRNDYVNKANDILNVNSFV